MLKICLDTSAYSLPCDVMPREDKRRIEDQKAIFRIAKLAEKQIVELFIPANVHFELRKCGIEKRKRIDEFWKSVKPQVIPQEIGFNGILARIGGERWTPLVGQFGRRFKVEIFAHHAAFPNLPCPGRGNPQYASSGVRSARLE